MAPVSVHCGARVVLDTGGNSRMRLDSFRFSSSIDASAPVEVLQLHASRWW